MHSDKENKLWIKMSYCIVLFLYCKSNESLQKTQEHRNAHPQRTIPSILSQGVHSPRLYTGISIRENGKKPKSIKLFCLLPKSIIIFDGENPEISQNCQKTKVITEIPICTTIYNFASHQSPAKLRLNIHQLSSDNDVSKYLFPTSENPNAKKKY